MSQAGEKTRPFLQPDLSPAPGSQGLYICTRQVWPSDGVFPAFVPNKESAHGVYANYLAEESILSELLEVSSESAVCKQSDIYVGTHGLRMAALQAVLRRERCRKAINIVQYLRPCDAMIKFGNEITAPRTGVILLSFC